MRLAGTKLAANHQYRGFGDQLYDLSGQRPSLDLNFSSTKSLVDATTGQNLVTFTRASSGTYVDSQGVIRTATANEARFDHNPTTGESLGLLVEESRTNLLLQSNGFDTTWTNSNSSETAAAGTAPDGTNTAWELKDTNDSGVATTHNLNQAGISFVSGTSYTFSLWAKSGTLSFITMLLPASGFTTQLAVRFNLANGTNTGVPAGVTATATAFPGGWYRISMTATATATASGTIIIRTAIAGTSSYAGDGTGTILIWGAQLEAGAFPTSYIPTTTATATRSADVASITGSNFSSWVNTSSGSFLSEVIPFSISNSRIIQMGDGTGNNRQDLAFSSGSVLAFVNTGGVTQVNAVTTNTASANVLSKVGYAYSLDDFAWTLNAGSIRTDTAGSLPVVNQLGIGQRLDSTGFLNGTLRRLCFWPRRLPNETLQGITQ